MSKSLYHQIYGCRMCGEEFCPVTTFGENAALNNMCSCINKGNGVAENYAMPYSATLYDVHHCKDGSFGVADFIGYRKDENSND